MTNERQGEEEEEEEEEEEKEKTRIPREPESWCTKILEYVKNRNRIGPGKIELAECDFFVVGPRRTLRVLLPKASGDPYYETTKNERPETIDENFVSRWASRPHPSGNCRCSFRRTRIRKRSNTLDDPDDDDSSESKKNKIVQDLEEYIEKLLQEVLADTMKFFNDAGDTLRKSNEVLNLDDSKKRPETTSHPEEERGYVNPAFSGTLNNPDSLEFRIQHSPSTDATNENLDCTDSGINSVETMEFQTSQEISLEQSLMEIMDAKFGKIASGEHVASHDTEESSQTVPVVPEARESEAVETPINVDSQDLEEPEKQPSFEKLQLEFLEPDGTATKKKNPVKTLRDKLSQSFSSVSCKKRVNDEDDEVEERVETTSANESTKENRVWQEVGDASGKQGVRVAEDGNKDVVKFRKYRKPVIVFLHGFGSSAEVFENQLEYFSKLGYPCVAPELLGHGMSSAPDRARDYKFDKLLRDLEIVLRHYAFRPGRKCVIVAHNYGCSFATALACKYDNEIHQLVLISGGGPTPLAPPSIEGTGRCCLRAFLSPLLVCGLRRDILYAARGRQHPYCGAETIEQRPSHMKYVLDGMTWPEGDYVFHRRISTPTLLVHGLRDDKVSLVQECQMERTIIKAFLDAIPTAGHTPMIDSPEEVNHMIHCFIDLWRRKKR
ncbi:uncharacterized protein [Venturia canescens]|uniref:uncharacterized protein n=1 Tax=Venturia canescens TaxID=32260 RepID=UPI001C9CB59F|nr:uncharacterized protein LOC122413844 [Venturia canescens]